MLTGEQRYHQAMLKARLIWKRQLAQYFSGDEPFIEALDMVEKRCLIAELGRGDDGLVAIPARGAAAEGS